MPSKVSSLEAILKRDRLVVGAGLAALVSLAWAYTIYLARAMAGMMPAGPGLALAVPAMRPWTALDFLVILAMWVVMQVAMMTPSAAPMILTFAKIERQRHPPPAPYLNTGLFFLGYILVWITFSAGASLAQWGLHTAALLSPRMATTSPIWGGLILTAAGLFQFSPLKHACLAHCRSPSSFFMTEWREGKGGAVRMGLRHGGFCVVCCWLLMALLFVAGVMNLLWIAAIAAYVLLEKVIPGGHRLGRAMGLLITGWGVWLVIF